MSEELKPCPFCGSAAPAGATMPKYEFPPPHVPGDPSMLKGGDANASNARDSRTEPIPATSPGVTTGASAPAGELGERLKTGEWEQAVLQGPNPTWFAQAATADARSAAALIESQAATIRRLEEGQAKLFGSVANTAAELVRVECQRDEASALVELMRSQRDTQTARAEAAERERDELQKWTAARRMQEDGWRTEADNRGAALAAAEAKLAKALEALEPFARHAVDSEGEEFFSRPDLVPDFNFWAIQITVGDLRRARAVLTQIREG